MLFVNVHCIFQEFSTIEEKKAEDNFKVNNVLINNLSCKSLNRLTLQAAEL